MDEATDKLNSPPANSVIVDHKELRQFQMQSHGSILFVEYEIRESKLFLTHTFIPKNLEETGAGNQLIENVLGYIETNYDLKIVPWSKRIATYIRSHKEWFRLLATGIRL